MRKPNLLFFDIDGTLFDDRTHAMPPSVAPALEAAKKRGNLLFLNTGRTLCNMDDVLDTLPLDGRIMGCGTRVVYHGQILRKMEYGHAASLDLWHRVAASGIPAVYECDTAIYFDPSTLARPEIASFQSFAVRRGIARMIREEDEEFLAVKMFMFSDRREPIDSLMEQLGRAGTPYQAIDRGRGGWEIVPGGFSKAEAIDFLCGHLGASLDECYAFGDSGNDLSMLEHVKHSVAVGNADERVKARCRYVTDRVEEDGIAKALYRLGLA